MPRTLKHGLQLICILVCVVPALFVDVAHSSEINGAKSIPDGTFTVTMVRRGGATSVPEILNDPLLQVVIQEVDGFYASHVAANTSPEELHAAIAPNHAQVVLHPVSDRYVFVTDASSGAQDVMRHWQCCLEVSDSPGEIPVVVTLDVRRILPWGLQQASVGLGVRNICITRESCAESVDELLRDAGVDTVRAEVANFMRTLSGATASPVVLAAWLEGWPGAEDVDLEAPDYQYEVIEDPVSGEVEIVCRVNQDVSIQLPGDDAPVTVGFEERMVIQ